MSDRYGSIAIGGEKPELPPGHHKKPLPKRSAPSPKKKGQTQRNKALLLVPATLFCIAFYFLATIYLAPIAIQKYLPRYIENTTGLSLTIGKSTLNPINFQLTLQDIVADLPQSPAAPPLLQLKSLFIDLDFTALLRNTFTCDKLTIEELELKLIRYKDKSYNIPVPSNFPDEQQPGEIINFAALPFLFSLNNIVINNSRILFSDELTKKSHSIEKLALAIPSVSNFSFQSENYIKPHFSAIINGSPIQLSGEAMLPGDKQRFETKLSCSIQSLDLVPWFSYLPKSFPLLLSQGRSDTTLQIAFTPDKEQGERLSIDISMTAADVALREKNDGFQLTLPAIKLDAVLKPFSKELHIKDIITRKAHLRGDTDKLRVVLQNILSPVSTKNGKPFAISIDQLLADQGQLTLNGSEAAKKNKSEWGALQLSIKNFHQAQSSGTIRVSGEQRKGKASFSWQGNLTKSGNIEGTLLLDRFPAHILFNLVLPDSGTGKTIQGSATFSGDLNFTAVDNSPPLYSIANGILQFHKIKLTEKSTPWLTSDSIRITRLSRTDKRYNLGNIFLKGTTLSVDSGALPPLFRQLFTGKKRPNMKGIDFSGTLQIRKDTDRQKMLQISEVHLQLNKLEKTSSTENFAFTGHLGTKGILKAKGICNLAPLRIETELAFSDVDAGPATQFFSKWPLLQNSKATLHGKGSYRFPEPSFQGTLRLSNTILQKTPKAPLLGWERAEFTNIRCDFSPFAFRADTLLLDKARLHWQRDNTSPLQALHNGIHGLLGKNPEKDILFPVSIKKTTITNASLSMLDSRISPAWKSSAENLQGHINTFNTTEKSSSSFSINGTIQNSAITLSGTTSLLENTAEGRARLTLSNFPLTVLARQIKGIPVQTDSAYLDLTIHMTESHSRYSSTSDLLIRDLLPLSTDSDTALTLAFLKNSRGSFPLKIQIDDVERSLIQESIAGFQTRVIKASYAPLLLAPSFKDLQEKNLIPFQPGTSTLGNTGRQILGRYADLLVQHPGLSLTLTGMADNKTDRKILHETLQTLEEQRVKKENIIGLAGYRRQQQAAVARKSGYTGNTLQEEDISKKDLAGYTPLLPQAVYVSDKALLELAGERKLAVYEYCIHDLGIAAEHLLVAKIGEIGEIGKIAGGSPANGVGIAITTFAETTE